MRDNPRILITNDDGIDAPGLSVMEAIARSVSDDVWVVAPDGNQSGAGHRVTFGRALRLQPRGPRRFAVHGGSPADCVTAGMTHLLTDRPADLVLSGVNNGQNLGDILHYSGTIAGAREGAFHGALGIAMSQAVNYEMTHEVVWDNAGLFGPQVLQSLIAALKDEQGPRHTYLSVNFPFCRPEAVRGIKVVGHQRFARSPLRFFQSEDEDLFYITIPETPLPLDPDSDFHSLHLGHVITVTPLALMQTDRPLLGRLSGRLKIKVPTSGVA